MPDDRRRDATIPVLVLGAPWTTTLAVIRSLGRNRVPHYTVGATGSFVAASRWHHALPDAGLQDTTHSLAEFLGKRRDDRMVLIPCSDNWALAVAGVQSTLGDRFPASIASRQTVEALVDKARFAGTLAELGIPHPRTVRLRTDADLVALGAQAFEGVFIKPRDSQAFLTRYGMKAIKVGTRSEALAHARRAREAGLEVMLQDYIPGPPSCHYMVEGFVDRAGSVRAHFVRQRLRMFPPDFGDSTYMTSRAVDTLREPIERLDRLLESLKYRGVFEAEFKYDERDGEFKLLEVNARPWGFIEFAAACGVDFCMMAYRDALGTPVEPVRTYAVGRHCVVPSLDAFACLALVRRRQLGSWDWVRSWAGAHQLVFAWDDPLPAVKSAVEVIRELLARLLGRLRPLVQRVLQPVSPPCRPW
jgi:D-aspartate ligase